MQIEKKLLAELDKCYSLAKLNYHGRPCFLAAAEGPDPCYLFSEDGELLEKVWDGPGGVMSMEAVPGREGAFLATHEFYSPDNGKQARIVLAEPDAGQGFSVRTLCDLPLVHRFGILSRNGVSYLLACTVKHDYEYPDDWRQPGAVYAAPLPEDLSEYGEGHQLRLYPIMTGLWHNHGFCKLAKSAWEEALIGSDEGVFRLTPPSEAGGAWKIRKLLDVPASDAVMADFDGDGEEEIGVITPFHGDGLEIWHKRKNDNTYERVYRHPYAMEMLHATWCGSFHGRLVWFVGCRKGVRQTLMISWQNGAWQADHIDDEAGAANCLQLDENRLVAANHTSGQVVLYTIG